MKTTINDVIRLIRRSDAPWHILGSGHIRTVQSCNCPVTFAAAKLDRGEYATSEIWAAAESIGLNYADAALIVDAADCCGLGGEPNLLRKRLLKAMKLKEDQ